MSKLLAWLVHVFTASGIVVGLWAIICVSNGQFIMAFWMLLLTQIIDGVDGTFARMVKTTEVLPNVSGKTMDYVIDFCTYAVIPAYLIYEATSITTGQFLLPNEVRFLIPATILITSTIYYGKEGMVSNDYYFVGFPVMWNLVAYYLYVVFELSPWMNVVIILFFCILQFIPIKFVYPSRTKKFKSMNIIMTFLILGSNAFLLIDASHWIDIGSQIGLMKILSISSLVYFGVTAVYHTYFDADTIGIRS